MNELTKEEHEVLLRHFEEEMGYEIGKGESARLERKKAKELVSLMEKTRYGAIVDGLNVAYHLSRSRRDHVSNCISFYSVLSVEEVRHR